MNSIFVIVDILHELFKVVRLEVLSCESFEISIVLELWQSCAGYAVENNLQELFEIGL